MIYDKLDNVGIYKGLDDRILAGLALLGSKVVQQAEPGRYEVDGENLFYSVDQYDTRPQAEGRLEAHRKYVDIQYLVSGIEWIGVRPLEGLQVQTPYDAGKDIEFYHPAEPMTKIIMQAGTFAIIWPYEAHLPCRMLDTPQPVKKIVVKVRING